MSATAFQRKRRELARQKEAEQSREVEDHNQNNEQVDEPDEQVNKQVDEVNEDQAENEQTAADEITLDDIEGMDKEQLQAELKERGINKPHNTSESKLKEALAYAIK